MTRRNAVASNTRRMLAILPSRSPKNSAVLMVPAGVFITQSYSVQEGGGIVGVELLEQIHAGEHLRESGQRRDEVFGAGERVDRALEVEIIGQIQTRGAHVALRP
jgi:hypothetical protein